MHCRRSKKSFDKVIRGYTRIKTIRDIRIFDEKGERLVPAGTCGIITAKDLGPGIYLAACAGNILLKVTDEDFIITGCERGARKHR